MHLSDTEAWQIRLKIELEGIRFDELARAAPDEESSSEKRMRLAVLWSQPTATVPKRSLLKIVIQRLGGALWPGLWMLGKHYRLIS